MRALGILVIVTAITGTVHGQSDSKRRAGRTFQVEVTAYCVSGETRSGTQTRPGIVAADPRVLPLGSIVRVEGLSRRHDGTYKVADTGPKVKGRHIDIFMASCTAAKRFGRQTATVRILARRSLRPASNSGSPPR